LKWATYMVVRPDDPDLRLGRLSIRRQSARKEDALVLRPSKRKTVDVGRR